MDTNNSSDFIPDTSQAQFVHGTSVGNELPPSQSPTFLTPSHLQNITTQAIQGATIPNGSGQGQMPLSPNSTFHLGLHNPGPLNTPDQQHQLPMLWFSTGSLRPQPTFQGILNVTSLAQDIHSCRSLSVSSPQDNAVTLPQVTSTESNNNLVQVSLTHPTYHSTLRTIIPPEEHLHSESLTETNSPSLGSNSAINRSILNNSDQEIHIKDLIKQSEFSISNIDSAPNISSIYSIAPSQSTNIEVTASVNSNRVMSCGLLEESLSHDSQELHANAECNMQNAVQNVAVSQITLQPDVISSVESNAHVTNIELDAVDPHLQVEIVYRNSNQICSPSQTIQVPFVQAVGNNKSDEDNIDHCLISSVTENGMKEKQLQKYEISLSLPESNKKSFQETINQELEMTSVNKNFEELVETVECYKCKLCPYINLTMKGVQQHVQNEHAGIIEFQKLEEECGNVKYNMDQDNSDRIQGDTDNSNENDNTENKINVNGDEDTVDLKQCDETVSMKMDTHISTKDERFLCSKCKKGFLKFDACKLHMMEEHDLRFEKMRLEKLQYEGQNVVCRQSNPPSKRSRGRPKKVVASICKENLFRERMLRTRRKQKIPKKMDSLGDTSEEDEANVKRHKTRKNLISNTVVSSRKNSEEISEDLGGTKKDMSPINSPLKKRGRPKGSKNTGITALRRKNPKLKVEEELGYRCEIDGCAIRMKSIDNLEYHRRCHIHAESGFTCPECFEKFDHWRNISVHLWRNHVIDMELYACDQCSYKTYSFSKLINMHKRIHSEERPFLCDICGKGFKTSKQLRNHKVIHLDKRRQRSFHSGECDICHRFFSDKRMLRVHKDTVHNKLRPFLCNYCGYAASCRSTLKMHMRQHTGEKPFSCNLCAYRTADHNSLRRHKMRHSGEKPYKCPFCTYACIQSSTYKTHLKNKHPGQDEGLMYSCDLCAFRTIKKDNYITHMADHKAGTIPTFGDQSIQIMNSKQGTMTMNPQQTVLVQTNQAVSNVAQIDSLSGSMTATQVMFSSIEEFKNKIAIAAQGYPLEIAPTDRYPILLGQLKGGQLENSTVVHIESTNELENVQGSHPEFLVHEAIVQDVQQLAHSETLPNQESITGEP